MKVAQRLQQSPIPQASTLPPLMLRGSVPVVTAPALPLPIHAGRASPMPSVSSATPGVYSHQTAASSVPVGAG